MNERIKELEKQATSTLPVNHEGYGSKGYIEQVEYFDKEKFAELIVKECEQRLRKEGELAKIQAFTGSEYKFAYMNQAANIVKQHFGVEE